MLWIANSICSTKDRKNYQDQSYHEWWKLLKNQHQRQTFKINFSITLESFVHTFSRKSPTGHELIVVLSSVYRFSSRWQKKTLTKIQDGYTRKAPKYLSVITTASISSTFNFFYLSTRSNCNSLSSLVVYRDSILSRLPPSGDRWKLTTWLNTCIERVSTN